MDELPKLPGLDFESRLKVKHHVPQSFKYVNGYRVPRAPPCGIGGEPLNEKSIQFCTTNDSVL